MDESLVVLLICLSLSNKTWVINYALIPNSTNLIDFRGRAVDISITISHKKPKHCMMHIAEVLCIYKGWMVFASFERNLYPNSFYICQMSGPKLAIMPKTTLS